MLSRTRLGSIVQLVVFGTVRKRGNELNTLAVISCNSRLGVVFFVATSNNVKSLGIAFLTLNFVTIVAKALL